MKNKKHQISNRWQIKSTTFQIGDHQAASAFDQSSVLSRLCNLQPWPHPGAVQYFNYINKQWKLDNVHPGAVQQINQSYQQQFTQRKGGIDISTMVTMTIIISVHTKQQSESDQCHMIVESDTHDSGVSKPAPLEKNLKWWWQKCWWFFSSVFGRRWRREWSDGAW